MSRHPSVKWAQRSDEVFITVELPDAKDVKLKLEPEGKFFFSATSGADDILYEVDIHLFDMVDPSESKASITTRHICYVVKKAESKWWNRLLKQEGKPPVFLKVDWNKWVDEDELNDIEPDMSIGDDFDFSTLNMGGGDGEDFDDDEDIDDADEGSDTEEEIEEEAVEAGNEPQAPTTIELAVATTSSEHESKA